jgi:hypothetical protein
MPIWDLSATPLSTTVRSGPEALRPHLSMGLPKRARAVCAGRPGLPSYIYFDIVVAGALG